jgi:hypothetical protein
MATIKKLGWAALLYLGGIAVVGALAYSIRLLIL